MEGMAKAVRAGRVDKAATKQSYSTPALEKGLDVLELLAKQPNGLTKSELARALNRTVSEIFRMLICLEQRGYIAQLNDDRYGLTLKLFQMVQEHPPTERLVLDATPAMRHVADATLQSCHLGVLELGKVTFLAQVNAPTRVGFYVRLGSTVDIMDSASGYVILAYQPLAQLQRILEEWKRETGRKPPSDLQTHLQRIRKAGHEKRASYLVKGVTNISCPIFNERGTAIAALAMPYIQTLEPGMSVVAAAEELRKAAAQITANLGGREPGKGLRFEVPA
jgi:DNA-binding IclR family transcriptional regulator